MDKKKYSDTEIENQKLRQHKNAILISNVNINKIIVSSKVSFGKKNNFIGYKDAKLSDLYAYLFQT